MSVPPQDIAHLAETIANLTGLGAEESWRRAALALQMDAIGQEEVAETATPYEILPQGDAFDRTSMTPAAREEAILRFLREEVWPSVPPEQLGRRLSAQEEAEILGY